MSQEITIIVMIDIQAALDANTLEGNIYLLDNLRTEGSTGVGTGQLTTAINGAHWADGSQAEEQLLNWLPSGIGSIPKTVSPSAQMHPLNATSKPELIKDSRGNLNPSVLKPMTVTGEHFDEGNADISALNHMTPFITGISGEAVDKNVLFPAQYGTPISIKDGWYWSATADSNLTGTYAYTLHITLFRRKKEGANVIWQPVEMTYQSHIKVTNQPTVNGFTHAGLSVLPIT